MVWIWFFRKYPYSYLGLYINFAANKFLLQRPYIVRFTIFNLLFVPSTNPFDNGLATEFSTASRSLSRPSAKRESSFMLDFLYRSINTEEAYISVYKFHGIPEYIPIVLLIADMSSSDTPCVQLKVPCPSIRNGKYHSL